MWEKAGIAVVTLTVATGMVDIILLVSYLILHFLNWFRS